MAQPSSFTAARKLFLATFVKHLFDNNEFVLASRNWNKYANTGSVEWTESGARPKSRRNGERGAATPKQDIKRSYSIDEFKTDPTILTWVEELVVSYAKRENILEEHIEQIREDIVMHILYKWVKGSKDVVIETTGDTKKGVDGTDAHAVTPDDFFDSQTEMDEQGVPDDGSRVAVVPASMMGDLRKYKDFHDRNKYPGMVLMNGAVGQIAGYNIFKRAKTLLFDVDGNPIERKTEGSDQEYQAQAGDSRTITLWHPKFVTRAISRKSKISLIDGHDGVEVSTTTIAGGDVYYSDGRGIITIREKKKAS
ncbi:hypothetical protein [uncultured Microscilla sp.]|uniref:hypothetical protein n=1 Tax=uncultured Microscilla sp. TaxID=432653 RepID=UPI00260177D5|nr:hypothetical protein [uncultured Microscilla sp.]